MTQLPPSLWPKTYRLATQRAWPPREDIDVGLLFEFANRQGLLPLLMADDTLPAEIVSVKGKYRALNALFRTRYQLSRTATLEISRILGPESFLFLKGSDYRHRLYLMPELRPMEDIDIFIPAASMAAAIERLKVAGYPRKYGAHGACFAANHEELSFVIDNVHLEAHRSFSQTIRARVDYNALWQRREPFVHDGVSGFRMAPSDMLLAHAYNAMAIDEFSSPLIRYVDFYLMLQQHEQELFESVARAKSWGIERSLYGALHTTSTVFPEFLTPTIKEAIALLLNPRTKAFLSAYVLPDPSRESSGHATGRLLQIWRKMLLIENMWRRLALVADHAYATAVGHFTEWRLVKNKVLVRRQPK